MDASPTTTILVFGSLSCFSSAADAVMASAATTMTDVDAADLETIPVSGSSSFFCAVEDVVAN